jgi:hypothetical protein
MRKFINIINEAAAETIVVEQPDAESIVITDKRGRAIRLSSEKQIKAAVANGDLRDDTMVKHTKGRETREMLASDCPLVQPFIQSRVEQPDRAVIISYNNRKIRLSTKKQLKQAVDKKAVTPETMITYREDGQDHQMKAKECSLFDFIFNPAS